MREHEHEPVRGLPERLPAGEALLWQGAPNWRALACDAFHVRAVAAYFALIVAFGLVTGAWAGAAVTALVGAAGLGVLGLLAWLAARTTVYTLTTKRLVMRFGIALPKCVNLPLAAIENADLALNRDGTGNLAIRLAEKSLGWLHFWPHVRPWKTARPEPMLRAIPDAEAVAGVLARQLTLAGRPQASTAPAPLETMAAAA